MQFHIEIWVYGFCRISVCIFCVLNRQIIAIGIVKGDFCYLPEQFSIFVCYAVYCRLYVLKVLLSFKRLIGKIWIIKDMFSLLALYLIFIAYRIVKPFSAFAITIN